MGERVGLLGGLLLMTLVCASAVAPCPAAAVQSADGRYECTVLSETAVEIDGFSGSDASMTIPYRLTLEDGTVRTVSAIDWYSFGDCSGLASIAIPSTVTRIGDGAFLHCVSLKSVVVPGSVTTLGKWVFEGCTSLTTATMGNSVSAIDASTFLGCRALRSVRIGTGVRAVGSAAFAGCTSLKALTLPNSVSAIGANAFGGWTKVSITPRAAMTKATSSKGTVKLAWKKSISGMVSGYQIYLTRGGKGTKTLTTKGSSTSKTIKKLAKGKKYSFKVRAYRTISGKRYYSSWSSVKTTKIK